MTPVTGPAALASGLRAGAVALAAWLGAAWAADAEVRLVMVEQPGCVWCARWNAEIGESYALTAEGRIAPLRRIDLRAPTPDDLSLARPAVFTPTFVLVDDGAEAGRIEGYPGEDFFWSLLGRLIDALPPEKRKDPKS